LGWIRKRGILVDPPEVVSVSQRFSVAGSGLFQRETSSLWLVR
jgi:hypothetical protein